MIKQIQVENEKMKVELILEKKVLLIEQLGKVLLQ